MAEVIALDYEARQLTDEEVDNLTAITEFEGSK